jgi:hypothetical protein
VQYQARVEKVLVEVSRAVVVRLSDGTEAVHEAPHNDAA